LFSTFFVAAKNQTPCDAVLAFTLPGCKRLMKSVLLCVL
jgi:hypothetical protein